MGDHNIGVTTLTTLEPIQTSHDYCISTIIIYPSIVYDNEAQIITQRTGTKTEN